MDCADARLGTLADSDSGFVLSAYSVCDGVLIEVDAGAIECFDPCGAFSDAEGGSFAHISLHLRRMQM